MNSSKGLISSQSSYGWQKMGIFSFVFFFFGCTLCLSCSLWLKGCQKVVYKARWCIAFDQVALLAQISSNTVVFR